MTGSIQVKKGRSNYYAVLNIYDGNGKRKPKWIDTHVPVKGNNKRKADAKLNELLLEYKDGHVNFSKDIYFADFMEQWLETRISTGAIAATTYDGYKLIFDTHIAPYFRAMKLKVKDLTPAHLEKYVNVKMKELSPNTIIKHLHNISKCLDNAIRQNYIGFNPAKRIDWPQKIRYTGAKSLTPPQIEQLLAAVKGDILETLILFGIFYGLRRSEILGLKWDAIDMDNDMFTIRHTVTRINKVIHKSDRTKNNSSYGNMPIPIIIKQSLERVLQLQEQDRLLQPNDYQGEGYIFTNRDGKLLLPGYVSKRFTQLLQHNGLPHIRFHDLRHSAAGYMKYLGFDMKDIQTWLRHGDIGTTMNIYVNLNMDAKTAIADNLNQRFQEFGT